MISLNVVVLLALMPFLSAEKSAPSCTYNPAPNAPFLTCNIRFLKGDSNKIETNIPNGYTKEKVTKIKVPNGKAIFKTFPAALCNEFPNLEELSLSDVGMKTIDKDLLKNCTKLKVLDISKNEGLRMEGDVFSNNPGLEILDLSNSYNGRLPSEIFKNLKELRSLNLSDNYWCQAPGDIFINNGKLEALFLNNVRYFVNNDQLFKPLVNLKKLCLSKSDTRVIGADIFGGLKNLEYLDLSECHVRAIDRNFFTNASIKILIMEGTNWCFEGTWTKEKDLKLLETCFEKFVTKDFEMTWYW